MPSTHESTLVAHLASLQQRPLSDATRERLAQALLDWFTAGWAAVGMPGASALRALARTSVPGPGPAPVFGGARRSPWRPASPMRASRTCARSTTRTAPPCCTRVWWRSRRCSRWRPRRRCRCAARRTPSWPATRWRCGWARPWAPATPRAFTPPRRRARWGRRRPARWRWACRRHSCTTPWASRPPSRLACGNWSMTRPTRPNRCTPASRCATA